MVGHDAIWRLHAACKAPDVDPGWWFPSVKVDERTAGPRSGGLAIAVCTGCPVRLDCLLAAVERGEDHGIWGGTGELTRRRLRSTSRQYGERRMRQEIQDHFDRLDEKARTGRMPEGQAVTFGPNARCGTAAKYARGCRCVSCREARMESQRRNAEAKRHLFGDGGEHAGDAA